MSNRFDIPDEDLVILLDENDKEQYFELLMTYDLGENVFTGAEGYYSAADGVRMWLGEKANYDPAVNGSRGGKTFGHYAQMVRPQAQKIGCAIASGCGNMFLVCSYRPGGSTAGAQPR